MRATNGRYFFAVLPFLVLAFVFRQPVPEGGAGLACCLLAALFVNETAFFLLKVIPFSGALTGSTGLHRRQRPHPSLSRGEREKR